MGVVLFNKHMHAHTHDEITIRDVQFKYKIKLHAFDLYGLFIIIVIVISLISYHPLVYFSIGILIGILAFFPTTRILLVIFP